MTVVKDLRGCSLLRVNRILKQRGTNYDLRSVYTQALSDAATVTIILGVIVGDFFLRMGYEGGTMGGRLEGEEEARYSQWSFFWTVSDLEARVGLVPTRSKGFDG